MLLNAKKHFWILLVLCIFLLFLPIFLRQINDVPVLMDSQSYRSINLAEQFSENGYNGFIQYNIQNSLFEEPSWYYILSFNSSFLAKFLSILLGVLSFILFYFIVSNKYSNLRGLASLILIISPGFIYIFIIATKYSAALFLLLLTIFLYQKNYRKISLLSLILVGFFSMIIMFLASVVTLYYLYRKKDYINFAVLIISFITLFILNFFNYFSALNQFNFSLYPKILTWSTFFDNLFFSLGSYGIGLSFFMLFASLFGIYNFYNHKYRFVFAYIVLFFSFILVFYIPTLISYLTLILAFFSAYGLVNFFYTEWKSDLFRFLSLVIVLCGFLFTFLVFYNNIVEFPPTSNFVNSIELLKQQAPGVVLTDYNYNDYVLYADKTSFIQGDFLYLNESLNYENLQIILYNNNYTLTRNLLIKYNVKYILLDDNMLNEIYNDRETGLYFIAKYGSEFNDLYNNTVYLWSFNNPKS
jgi:hypothetical protein